MNTRDHTKKKTGTNESSKANVTSQKSLNEQAQLVKMETRPTDPQQLQRAYGNRATRHIIQAKLKLGSAGDSYEQEADRVAKQVVNNLGQPQIQRDGLEEEELQAKPIAQGISTLQRQEMEEEELLQGKLTPESNPVQREVEEEELLQGKLLASPVQRQEEEEELLQGKRLDTLQRQEEEEELQAKPAHGLEGGDVDTDVAQTIESAKGGGQALEDGTRAAMEQGFGADFRGVRIHTGGQADALNRSLNARAFTTGSNIFFGAGQYNPTSQTGQELLAHELTHTVQQGGAAVQRQESSIAKNILQLKRAYRGLNSRLRGNNDLRILNKSNYHVSIPDPERVLEFDEFHITYENNTEGRQAHFFYSDKPQYQPNGEEHAQNQRYRSDANQEGSGLTAFSTLKTESETKATAFVQEVETAEQELAERLKQAKIAKEKQDKANTAFEQGKNGLKVESRFKPPPSGGSVWGAKPKYTQKEAKEITERILALLPSGSSMKKLTPVNSGEKFEIKYTINDIRVEGPDAIDAAMDDPSVATVEYDTV